MSQQSRLTVGVLDIQGSVIEHVRKLEKLAVRVVKVKSAKDLRQLAGLIIPGGESTTIGKLLKITGLDQEIIKCYKKGTLAIYGTCAGAILLAKKLVGGQAVNSLKLMDITIERNAYGRQLDSFESEILLNLSGKKLNIPAVFIRAPRILKAGKTVKILSEHRAEPILVQEGKLLAGTFHPEMTDSTVIHSYFLKLCAS